MSDLYVNKWKQTGRLYLWKYLENIKNYPGWNLTVDNDGGKSLSDLLDRMENSVYPCLRTMKVSKPNEKILRIPNNKGGRARWYSPDTFKLRYVNDHIKNYWDFEENGTSLLLSVNKKELSELKKGILSISEGCGDFSIGSDIKKTDSKNIRLWFWWYNSGDTILN